VLLHTMELAWTSGFLFNEVLRDIPCIESSSLVSRNRTAPTVLAALHKYESDAVYQQNKYPKRD